MCDMCADEYIGDEGARALATALQSNHTLTSLDLGGKYARSECFLSCVQAVMF